MPGPAPEPLAREVLAHSPVAIAVHRNGRILTANPACAALLGLGSEAELVGREVAGYLDPSYRETAAERFARLSAEGGVAQTLEMRAIRPDGRVVEVEVTSVAAEYGGESAIHSIVVDISGRKRAEAALFRHEQWFRSIAENAPDMIVRYDRGLRHAYVNPAGARLLGRAREALVGRTPRELGMREPHVSRLEGDLLEVLRSGAPRELVYELRIAGGAAWLQTRMVPERGPGGEVESVLVIAREVTAARRAEAALRESEERYRALFDQAPVGVFLYDSELRITRCNERLLETLQAAREVVIGFDLRTSRDTRLLPALRAALSGGTGGYEGPYRSTVGGLESWLALRTAPLRDASGEVRGGMGVVEDLSARRAAEAELEEGRRQLLQAQKLEAMGRLAGAVVHDFNNVLTTIRGHAQLLQLDLPRAPEPGEDLEQILLAVDRAGALTRQLLVFGRRQPQPARVVDPDAVVRGLEPMLRRLIGEDVSLQLELAVPAGAVRIDPGQLEQLVTNLAVNARDAMPAGGTLRIASTPVRLPPERTRRHGHAPGSFALLSVRDTGEGIDPEVLPRIFEPFFTTKELGKGTGLGLATVAGIARQAGGFVEVDSTPGAGSEFRVYLPLAPVPPEQPEPAEAAPAPPHASGEAVLVVEDDDAVRALTGRILERHGFRVLSAARPAQALDLAHAHAEIHLLVADLVLPQMRGPDLARILRTDHPGLPVLFLSGYPDEPVPADQPFLAKPFAAEQLLHAVLRAIGG